MMVLIFLQFRLYEPVHRHLPCPARNDQLMAKAELLDRIRSADELAQNRMARAAYDTLCSFYKLAESKINQAYVEEQFIAVSERVMTISSLLAECASNPTTTAGHNFKGFV
ncbi:hypothetical protein niasHS_004308 [Heterodera schachtii]|uniref:Uncharacterized protein n=1 Tax=Heterodera schachtii TaxID=97005 RepID=A0ABD2JUU5_HETSC